MIESHFCAGRGIMSLSEKRRNRKSCTASRVSGPPKFSSMTPVLGLGRGRGGEHCTS